MSFVWVVLGVILASLALTELRVPIFLSEILVLGIGVS